MKHLLLSTTLILGTLTGVKGAGATLDSIAAEVANVQTEVQTLQADVTTLQAAVTAVDARIQALKAGATTIDARIQALQTIATTLQTTVQQLVPYTLSELGALTPTALVAAIKTAYINLDRIPTPGTHPLVFDETVMTHLQSTVYSSTLLHPNALERNKKRVAIAEQIIVEYFNQIIDHKGWTKSQLLTPQNMVIFTACAILNIWTLYQFFCTSIKFYPSVPPMTGGVSVITLNNLVTAYVAQSQSMPLSRIQTTWKDRLSNPAVKSYISSLLALEFVHKNADISPKSIQQKLENVMSQQNSFANLRP